MSAAKKEEEQSTVRLDDDKSTVRLENNSETVRLQPEGGAVASDAGSGAGIVSGAIHQQMAMVHDRASVQTGELFSVGQVIEINNKSCTIESIISRNSGEAVIYKVKIDGWPFVLKHYKINTPLSDSAKAVLRKIKDNPKERIVKLSDFGRRYDQDYEIMEFAEGGTLDQYLKDNGPIKDITKLKNIVGQITEGLEQLHNELRIIYQDLKPENIYFRDAQKTKLILGDFGISSLMEPGKNSAEVTANATTIYAAPDLARIGNEKNAIVGPPVDYFALGITLLHLWIGATPFQNIPEAERFRQIRDNDVEFPQDMPADCKTLIQGLIQNSSKDRWGNQHVKKWLAGESLEIEYRKTSITYESRLFNETENYNNPKELAALMDKYPERGKQCLYSDILTSWLKKAGDHFLCNDIENIISTYANDKDSGLYLAINTLDTARPFVTNGGKSCLTTAEIADAIMAESKYYMEDLKKANARLYLYMEAINGTTGKVLAEQLHKNFDEFSPKRALNLMYLKLISDGDQGITIGLKTYFDHDEIAAETDNTQIDLIKKAIQEEDSLFLVWLSDQCGEFFTSTVAFNNLPVNDKFFLLGKFKFLSYKELVQNWEENALFDLCTLITDCVGRIDLFEAYADQELPFTGQIQTIDWMPTALCYLAAFFKDITNNDADKGIELARFLVKQGADINEETGQGDTPLSIAVVKRNVPLVELFLELGADPDETNSHGYEPLMLALYKLTDNGEEEEDAAENDRITIANMLINSNAKVNISDEDGRTPLHLTMFLDFAKNKKEKLALLELLLKKGAKTETLQNNGYCSPLMLASGNNIIDVAQLLLKYGAKKDFTDIDGSTAFVYAAQEKHKKMMELVDPGKELAFKCGLPSAAKKAASVLAIGSVFLTMDALARIILTLHLSYPVLLGVSTMLSHLLAAYTLIIMLGLREYLIRLRGAFNFIGRGLLYLIGVPLFFPLAVLLLHSIIRLLPQGIVAALSFPADMIIRLNSTTAMLIVYIVILAAMMAIVMFATMINDKFAKIWRIYKQYS